MTQPRRIGDFTVLPLHLRLLFLVVLGLVIAIYLAWRNSMENEYVAPWSRTYMITAVCGTGLVYAFFWFGHQIVWWVEIGDTLRYATSFGVSNVYWEEVAGIHFEVEHQGTKIPFMPMKVVTNTRTHVVIALKNGRVLQGLINDREQELLTEWMRMEPQLDTLRKDSLSSPRGLMMTFVEALDENRDLGAVHCLELSDDADLAKAIPVAQKLRAILDEYWFIDFEELPEKPDCMSPIVLAALTSQELPEENLKVLQNIQISRDRKTGIWRFTDSTLAWVRSFEL